MKRLYKSAIKTNMNRKRMHLLLLNSLLIRRQESAR